MAPHATLTRVPSGAGEPPTAAAEPRPAAPPCRAAVGVRCTGRARDRQALCLGQCLGSCHRMCGWKLPAQHVREGRAAGRCEGGGQPAGIHAPGASGSCTRATACHGVAGQAYGPRHACTAACGACWRSLTCWKARSTGPRPGAHRGLLLVGHARLALPSADDDVEAVHLVLLERGVLGLGVRQRPVEHALVAVDDEALELVAQHALHQRAAVCVHHLRAWGDRVRHTRWGPAMTKRPSWWLCTPPPACSRARAPPARGAWCRAGWCAQAARGGRALWACAAPDRGRGFRV